MKSHNISNNREGFLGLWSYFHNKSVEMLDNVVGNNETTIILWSSDLTSPNHIEKYLDKNR